MSKVALMRDIADFIIAHSFAFLSEYLLLMFPSDNLDCQGELTSAGRFMKGSALLRSAFNETKDCCCVTVGAKAEADAERRARTAADFIMVVLI